LGISTIISSTSLNEKSSWPSNLPPITPIYSLSSGPQSRSRETGNKEIRLRGGPETFAPGTRPTLFRLQSGVSFGALICFEDIFPDLVRGSAGLGADFVFVLINTERFNESSAPVQRLRRAQLTAAAVGLPMVRVTNSRISAFIDARGQVVDIVRSVDGQQVGAREPVCSTLCSGSALRCTGAQWNIFSFHVLFFLSGFPMTHGAHATPVRCLASDRFAVWINSPRRSQRGFATACLPRAPRARARRGGIRSRQNPND
jgi:hypothetical protein